MTIYIGSSFLLAAFNQFLRSSKVGVFVYIISYGKHYFHSIRIDVVSLDNKLFVFANYLLVPVLLLQYCSILLPCECVNIQMDEPNWATDNLRANGLYYEAMLMT